MQNFTDMQWEKTGCFVYRITDENGVCVRSTIDVGDKFKTSQSFKKNDLVSVDLNGPSRHPKSTNGPFL